MGRLRDSPLDGARLWLQRVERIFASHNNRITEHPLG